MGFNSGFKGLMKLEFSRQLLWLCAVDGGIQDSSHVLLAISGQRIPISYSHYLQITCNFISTSFPWSFSVPFLSISQAQFVLVFFLRSSFLVRSFLTSYSIIPNYSQQDATFLVLFIFADAVHVSGGFSAHHQEHITVHTASGVVKL